MKGKTITVENLVRKFSMKVLAGENLQEKTIMQSRVHRPGLEFVGHFDFFPTERIQILGRKEINYLHKLSKEERKIRIGNIVNYHPPCFIVTAGEEGLTYLTQYCIEEGIPLLTTNKPETDDRIYHKVGCVFGEGISTRNDDTWSLYECVWDWYFITWQFGGREK